MFSTVEFIITVSCGGLDHTSMSLRYLAHGSRKRPVKTSTHLETSSMELVLWGRTVGFCVLDWEIMRE